MNCRCRSGECDPECDGPKLRAEIERLASLADDMGQTNIMNQIEIERLRAKIERLTWALQRIDGINDNPAVYNPMIEEVLRGAALEPKP
jgi:hypothetical protein